MNIINASNLTKFGQATLSLGIRVLVIGALGGFDYLSKTYTGWSVPPILIPPIGMVIAEADSWLVTWEKANLSA